MMRKLQSRKFWICAAAFLASLGTGITGLASGNETFTICGGICMVVSGAIYAACEAYVDGASLKSSQSITQISASSTDKTVVAKALGNVETPAKPENKVE